MSEPLWLPKRRIELEFRRALRQIAREIVRAAAGAGDAQELERVLVSLTRSPRFQHFAEKAAMKMVTGLFQDQGHTWRQAARANGMGRELYAALRRELRGTAGARLRQLVGEVTYRIVTLPSSIGHDVADHVARESLKGRRASDIAAEILKMFPEKTRANADLIARTQVSMTSTNLTWRRCEELGLDWYVWRPVAGAKGDGRTRESHRKMAGVLVRWNDPPAPEDLFPRVGKDGKPYKNTLGHYHAGQCPNCRCYCQPLISIDDVEWPSRVYRSGKIQSLSKSQFKKIMG